MSDFPNKEAHEARFILGYIDSYGSIHAREVSAHESHTTEERTLGRMFRFSLWAQEFMVFWGGRTPDMRMTLEDHVSVLDWLDSRGYLRKEAREMLESYRKRINSALDKPL